MFFPRTATGYMCIFMPPPSDRCVGVTVILGGPSVSCVLLCVIPSVRSFVRLARLQTNELNFTKLWLTTQLRKEMNWLDFEGRVFKVKVAVSYCYVRRHTHRRSAVEVSCSQLYYLLFIYCLLYQLYYLLKSARLRCTRKIETLDFSSLTLLCVQPVSDGAAARGRQRADVFQLFAESDRTPLHTAR